MMEGKEIKDAAQDVINYFSQPASARYPLLSAIISSKKQKICKGVIRANNLGEKK